MLQTFWFLTLQKLLTRYNGRTKTLYLTYSKNFNTFIFLSVYYQYYYYPGVPHALYGSRNIVVEVSGTNFLHCIPQGKPACGLLKVRSVTPARKGFKPSGK